MTQDAPVFQINEEGQETKYFLRGQDNMPSGHSEDIQISEGQFTAVINYGKSLSGNLSEAEILRLHQEQDPASPFFKGPQPAGTELPGATAEGTEPAAAYYEPTGDKVDPVADAIPEPTGTTVSSTEEVTRPYEAPETTPEPEVDTAILAEDVPASSETNQEEAPVTPAEDAGTAGA